MQRHPSSSLYCTNTTNLQKTTLLPPNKTKVLLSQLLWQFCRRKSAENQSLPSDLSFYCVYHMSSCSFRFLMVPGFSKYYQRPQFKLGDWGRRASSFLCRMMSHYIFTVKYSSFLPQISEHRWRVPGKPKAVFRALFVSFQVYVMNWIVKSA